MRPTSRMALTMALAAGIWTTAPRPAAAHDIPARVTVLAFLRPDGQVLRVVVRGPLEAMRDLDFPLRGPGYLDLSRAGPLLSDAANAWVPRGVAPRGSPPSDRSFETFASALARVTGPPLPAGTELVWRQAMLDVLLEYPIVSERSSFAIDPAFARLGLRTATVLRFLPPGRAERAFEFTGDPGLVRLDPRRHQAALRFVKLGFLHILDGLDHLLFVLCLVIPVRRIRPLVAVVTSFTVAHSVTLIA